MKQFFIRRIILSLLVLSVVTPTLVLAEGECGNIVQNFDGEIMITPIGDCDNPFGVLVENDALQVGLGGSPLIQGETYPVLNAGPQEISIEGSVEQIVYGSLYLHEGSDYIYEGDISADKPRYAFIKPGTYTLVIFEYSVFQVRNTLFQKVRDLLVPTAFASFSEPSRIITFSITEPVPEKQGMSNILFIPGIMGSRLYEKSEECDGELREQQRWVSRDDCDQLRFVTSFIGTSPNAIYTKAGEEGIVEEVYTFNLYKTFLNTLSDWKDQEMIKDYTATPYDWRLMLGSILKSKQDLATDIVSYDLTIPLEESYIYEALKKLVANSNSGKVTIVAHSNGGLVAKYFLTALEEKDDALLEKIDALILVGSPQLGTPDALIGILQGTEVDHVVTQSITRELMNTAPFAHHLLPSSDYFDTVSTPVITFESGSSTDLWQSQFGEKIVNTTAMYTFLDKESGRTKPERKDLATPEVVDGALIAYAKTIDAFMSTWQAPTSTKVYQIAGVGLETPAGITYFTDKECVSRTFFVCTAHGPKLGYRVTMTSDGDGTVVEPSALGMASADNVERRWLNIKNYNLTNFDRRHRDLLEVDDVIDFIFHTVQATTSVYDYLKETRPVFEDENRLIFQLHSPLDMKFVNGSGDEISSTTNTIEGSTYKRYGELQYISVPRQNSDSHLYLEGVATGSFTLDVEEMNTDSALTRVTYSGIPSSTSTNAVLLIPRNESIEDGQIEVDYNGDGVFDITYDESGALTETTYSDLYEVIHALSLKKQFKRILLSTAEHAEKFHKKTDSPRFKRQERILLRTLLHEVELYRRLRLITKNQKDEIENIVNRLLNN